MQKISFDMKFVDVFPETDSIEVPEATRACVLQTAEKPSKAELIENAYRFSVQIILLVNCKCLCLKKMTGNITQVFVI